MKRNDWIGLGTSVGVHLALLLSFALLTTGRPEAPALGALQLEVGAFAEGRPVRRATTPEDVSPPPDDETSSPAETRSKPSPEAEEPASEPKQKMPVNLPEQEASPGDEPPPEEPSTEKKPTPQPPPAASDADEAAAPENQAAQNESSEASDEGGEEAGQATGASDGEEGAEDDAEKAAPFDIEGLDRTRLHGALPAYTEKVNATIKVEITVSPQGRVVGQRLLQKANPSLERSVLETLRQWRFNRLPGGAPQENQTGIVTFRFRLE